MRPAAQSLLLVLVAGLTATACSGFQPPREAAVPARATDPVPTPAPPASPPASGLQDPVPTEQRLPGIAEEVVATLTVVQGSFRMSMEVAPDGSVDLSEHAPLTGRIDVGPILAAEERDVKTVQVLLHEGRYYITADGFRNLWEVTPTPGTSVASFRPIFVSDLPLSDVRISRYGPPEDPCVRVDATKIGGPWFLSDEGRLRDRCR